MPKALKVPAVLKESDDVTIIKIILMSLAKKFPLNIMRNKDFYVCMHFYEYSFKNKKNVSSSSQNFG